MSPRIDETYRVENGLFRIGHGHWGNPVEHQFVDEVVFEIFSFSQNAIFLYQRVDIDDSRMNRFRVNDSLQASRFKLFC